MPGQDTVELAVSDPAKLRSLAGALTAVGQVRVELTSGRPGPGEQGVADVLTVVATSSGLIAAIKVLPEFIRSCRSSFTIELTFRGEKFTLTVSNADKETVRILKRLLEGPHGD